MPVNNGVILAMAFKKPYNGVDETVHSVDESLHRRSRNIYNGIHERIQWHSRSLAMALKKLYNGVDQTSTTALTKPYNGIHDSVMPLTVNMTSSKGFIDSRREYIWLTIRHLFIQTWSICIENCHMLCIHQFLNTANECTQNSAIAVRHLIVQNSTKYILKDHMLPHYTNPQHSYFWNRCTSPDCTDLYKVLFELPYVSSLYRLSAFIF